MRNKDPKASVIRVAKTVSATVSACVVVLLLLQPWRSVDNDFSAPEEKAMLSSATTAELARPAPSAADEPKQLKAALLPNTPSVVKKPKQVTVVTPELHPQDEQQVQTAETSEELEVADTDRGGEIRLAAQGDTTGAVPVPEKDELIPLPVRNDIRPDEKPAVTVALPEPASKANMPPPQRQLSKVEGDKALATLLSYDVPEQDIEALKDFVKLVYRRDFSEARPLMEDMRDPVAKKFARWYYYRKKAPDVEASEILEFLEKNPRWPDRDVLRESAEDALFWREEDAKAVIAHFRKSQPESGVGLAAFGKALIAEGQKEKGTEFVRQAWRKYPLTKAIEKKLRKLKVLKAEDHRARADYLLMQDNRRYVSAAKRLLPLIEKKWRPSVKARIATVKRSRRAGTLLTRLDKEIKKDPGVLFARIQWLRRADNDEKAQDLLQLAPTSAEELIDPTEWWTEREIQIRLALNEGEYKKAYELAKHHGDGLEHWDLSDAEFLAGWIALRFLNDPKTAGKHFTAAAAAGGLPKRRARAAYWLGRTALVLKDRSGATGYFAEAAQHNHTFYGQLAHQMIAATDAKVSFRTFVRPSQREIDAFVEQDMMKAIVIAYKADFENLMSVFLYDLAREIESAPEMILLCELAIRVAPQHRAVRMAKIAMNRDFPVEHYAYPNALPTFKALADGQDLENALIHALTRQESEFNTSIVSSAGAVGLMQLLPSTAKMVARRHSVGYSKSKLSRDPAYNVSLGTAFLHRLVKNYDGSYIMALAGYNAGPGRIRQWVRQFGDPRDSKVDPIDWIERIPFTETRGYVHKIIESAQVYRSRLDGDNAPLRIAEDLHRGRKDKPKFLIGAESN